MTMNHQPDFVISKQLIDSLLVDVHDVHGLAALRVAAAFTHAGDDGFALRQCLSQEGLLPGRFAYLLAESHVGGIVSTLRIAVYK